MWKLAALVVCWLIPSICCVAAGYWSGTPEAVMAGTVVGGFLAVIVAISFIV